MKRENIAFIGILLALVALFVVAPIIFRVYNIEILPSQFFGALIGVFITAIVTAFLLRGQTKGDEKREKSVKIYEEKLEIYKEFLSKFHEIIKKGEISDENVKELIFQTSYVAMHTDSQRVKDIVKKMNDTVRNIKGKRHGQLAADVLEVVLVLKEELYNEKINKFDDEIFACFDELFAGIEKPASEVQQSIQTVEITEDKKIEMQTYFWKNLVKELKNINPDYSPDDWSEEIMENGVKEYYARARNRYRYYGIGFDIYNSHSGRNVKFWVELENDYYYGFFWGDKNPQSDEDLIQIVKQVSNKYKTNQWWGGWRYPDYSNEETRHDLNFWKFIQHTGMKRLMDPNKRDKLMREIAEEMDEQIKKFVEVAKQNNL